jgi:hypothetical protein
MSHSNKSRSCAEANTPSRSTLISPSSVSGAGVVYGPTDVLPLAEKLATIRNASLVVGDTEGETTFWAVPLPVAAASIGLLVSAPPRT